MLLGSFKPDGELQRIPPDLVARGTRRWTTTASCSTGLDFPQFFANSVLVAVAVTVGNLLFCSMVGYALAKLDFPGKRAAVRAGHGHADGARAWSPSCRCSCSSPTWAWSTPTPALILPFLATPLGVFLMRQFMMGMPDELIEAARIDGAGEWRIFSRMMHAAVRARRWRRWASSPSSLLEQLPVAAGRGPVRGQVHPAGRPGPVLASARTPPTTGCCWPARWWSSSR